MSRRGAGAGRAHTTHLPWSSASSLPLGAQATLTARGLATKEVQEGTPWEQRPNSFEFVVELHRAADSPLAPPGHKKVSGGGSAPVGGFRDAHTAGMARNFAQLREAMESGGDGGGEDGEPEGGE